VVVGALIVLVADRFTNRDEAEGEQTHEETGAATAETKSDSSPRDQAQNMRVVPSPGRQCLLAWQGETDGSGGRCDCTRDEVTLWSVHLQRPLFMAVTDSGCAALIDNRGESGGTSIQLIDVAGIERLRETLPTFPLEWGTAKDGKHVWCVAEPETAAPEVPPTFLLFAVEEGALAVETGDPRHGSKSATGQITSVGIFGGSAVIDVDSGQSLTVPLAVRPTVQANLRQPLAVNA
jgi:hypothetical protein